MALRPFVVVFLGLVLVFCWGLAFVLYKAAEVGERVMPLETRHFERFTVVTLGTGGSYENPDRLGPSTGIGWDEGFVLVDAGRGVAESLRNAQLPVAQPSIVFVTNWLPENVVGLDDLLLTGWLEGREERLRVVGPEGTAAQLAALLRAHDASIAAMGASLALPAAGAQVDVVEAGEGWQEEIDGMKIEAAQLPDGPLPALAYRFEHHGRSVVVSGTGWGKTRLVEFARDANLWVHDAVSIPTAEEIVELGILVDPERMQRESEIRTSILEVGELAHRARVDAIALVRMRPPPFFPFQTSGIVSRSYGGQIIVPEDGDELQP